MGPITSFTISFLNFRLGYLFLTGSWKSFSVAANTFACFWCLLNSNVPSTCSKGMHSAAFLSLSDVFFMLDWLLVCVFDMLAIIHLDVPLNLCWRLWFHFDEKTVWLTQFNWLWFLFYLILVAQQTFMCFGARLPFQCHLDHLLVLGAMSTIDVSFCLFAVLIAEFGLYSPYMLALPMSTVC